MLKYVLIAIMLGAGTLQAAAESAYVTDSLRLGIHQAADTSDKAFDNLVSGDKLEILERSPNFARVRLEDGREGWVKANYLVTQKPAAARIAELEAEVTGLKEHATAAKAAQLSAEQELGQLTNQAGSLAAINANVARLEAENHTYEAQLASYRMALPMAWVLLAVVVALVAGFLAGLWWLDSLIRRRHGGFRVY